VRLRFIRGNALISKAILLDTGGLYSHVEAVTPNGQYLGAHLDGGVLARPSDYDKGKFDLEKFLDLPSNKVWDHLFYGYLDACLGEPYDFGTIAGFVSHYDLHQKHKVICSALQLLALRYCGWFPYPIAQPAHEISPRDLFLLISARMNVS
jgi:hypothetical protein